MSVFKNKIEKNIDNNKDYCYLDNNNCSDIDNIIKDTSQIYKYKYLIKTNKQELKTYLIGKNDKYITTFNGEKIDINDIISIDIIT